MRRQSTRNLPIKTSDLPTVGQIPMTDSKTFTREALTVANKYFSCCSRICRLSGVTFTSMLSAVQRYSLTHKPSSHQLFTIDKQQNKMTTRLTTTTMMNECDDDNCEDDDKSKISKGLPKSMAHTAAPISMCSALSQTSAYTARSRI